MENILKNIWEYLPHANIVIDFILIWLIAYGIIYFSRGAKTSLAIVGFLILFLGLGFIAEMLQLRMMTYILRDFLPPLFGTALLIIFQQEIRSIIAGFGHLFISGGGLLKKGYTSANTIKEVVEAATAMAKKHTGALIVFERNAGLSNYIKSGETLRAQVNNMLLQSIFYPNSPLHDCAVIINKDKIVAARVVLPLADESFINDGMTYGTRHRAALGITQETDAIALVVSEEKGIVSLACNNKLIRDLNNVQLQIKLEELLINSSPETVNGKKEEKD